MERLQRRELSRRLAQATRMSIGEAEKFVAEFFAIIARGTAAEESVEIYGFGRFTRDGFEPCPQLADAVNKPFVNFQPVEVTADVEPDEVVNQETEENIGPDHRARQDEEEMAGGHDGPPLQMDSESPGDREPETPENREPEEPETPQEAPRKLAPWLAVAVVVAAVVLAAGFVGVNKYQQRKAELAEAARLDSIETARQDSIRRDSIYLANLSPEDREMVLARRMVGDGVPGAEEIPCHYTLENAKQLMPYSAYIIDGTDTVVVVQKGQSLKEIGDEHGLPYGEFIIQLHNGLESVKEGQRIRIPHLKRK